MSTSRSRLSAEGPSRRDSILDETLRIVGERGYHGFGIQELAERCGLTKPGLLHHFGTKDQLLIALLHDRDAKTEAELADLLEEGFNVAASADDQREMFRQGMRAVAERTLAQPKLVRLHVVLRAEAINPDHPAHAYFVEREKATLKRVSMRMACFSAHPESAARQILAMKSGLEEQWLREAESFDFMAEWDRVLTVLLR